MDNLIRIVENDEHSFHFLFLQVHFFNVCSSKLFHTELWRFVNGFVPISLP